MTDLLPCPFCGSDDAEVYPDYPVYVKCGACGTCGPCVRNSGNEWALAKAVELWNRRAPSLFGRPVIESDAQEALNKVMEELFLHGDATKRPVGFLPLDSA